MANCGLAPKEAAKEGRVMPNTRHIPKKVTVIYTPPPPGVEMEEVKKMQIQAMADLFRKHLWPNERSQKGA